MNNHEPKSCPVMIVVLMQAVFYLAFWLTNDYIASLMTVLLPLIGLSVLIISKIADWLEPSRVGTCFYYLLWTVVVVPLVVGGFYVWMTEGYLDWMDPVRWDSMKG